MRTVSYVNPQVTVSTLIVRDGKILVGRRKHAPIWQIDLPGGFLEPNESLEDAARREVQEETGLELYHLVYFTSRPSKYFDGRDILCVHFLAKTDGEPRETDELSHFLWFEPQERCVELMASESDGLAIQDTLTQRLFRYFQLL